MSQLSEPTCESCLKSTLGVGCRTGWAAVAFGACLGLALTARAQGAEDQESEDDSQIPASEPEDNTIHVDTSPPLHPAVWRGFGAGYRRFRDHGPAWNFGRRRGYVEIERYWPAQLVYRPMSPWSGMIEARTLGEADLGAGHAGSPLRLGATLAYGLGDDVRGWALAPWGFVLGVGRGLCVNSTDGRCDRRFDQVSADVVYVMVSSYHFEWLVKTGLALGPVEPTAYGLRAAIAAKWLVDPIALQVDVTAEVPINQRDTIPIVTALPVQLQFQLQRRLAVYLLSGYRGALLSGTNDSAIPVGAGVLLGARSFDLGAEWRFPRVLGTRRTWDERSLFVTLALRYF